ncbi:PucR family transcriptional regulator [Actinomadura sp. WAC 06369]|uniref:PucR family transcriptional regulator n=1 Tax=Actinomadura sp. WAC 06369 TaxID=2203193 RepID=UPI000F76C4AC|nr:PucR family transcriptional regulator [Actinomadura sp. WAC 06369]RSN68946.1 PucR family transcriptional regulator [Actinomadura sp. WAC 06369]
MAISVADLAGSLGPSLLRVLTEGRAGPVDDVVLAEPGEPAGQPGDLVLGIGLHSAAAAVALLERADAAGAAAVAVKAPLAAAAAPAARTRAPALVELQPDASWAHLVWLVRGAVDRAGAPLPGSPGAHDDLFALADAAAEIAGAPVTVEDARSRVLAYSGLQDATDPARVSTIVGRRVPPQVTAHLRACGVFRKMAGSSDPIAVPAGPDGMLPRLVVPVRAGGEWLGSIWAVARTPIPDARVRRLTELASVLALHLLRLRADAEVARRVSAEHLRAALRDGSPLAVPDPPPWRVAILGARGGGDARRALDLWEAIARRFGWRRPLLTDLDGALHAVLTAGPGGRAREPGSPPWLADVLARVRDPDLYAAIGGPAAAPADLPRSRAEAAELDGLAASGRLAAAGTVLLEDAWDAVVVERARRAVGPDVLGSPLRALREHDAEHGTSYLPTLAAWLDHFGDPKGAAAELRIHPNTLRYRLRRMADTAPLDLASSRVRLALRLQLAALPDAAGRA